MSGALFWLGGGGWDIILGEWTWVGHYFGGVGVGGTLFWVSGRGWDSILGGWG